MLEGIGPNDAGYSSHTRSNATTGMMIAGIPVMEVPAIAARLCFRPVCQHLISFLDSKEVLFSRRLLVDVRMMSAA